MAYVNSLKYIWEKTDSSYIQATKPEGRTPVCQRLFPQAGIERNRLNKGLQKEEKYCEDTSETSSNHESVGDFDAIPEEFRPSKRGKGLMKVRTSPKKEDPSKRTNVEPSQNERFSKKPITSQGKRGIRNLNPSTIPNEVGNYEKEPLKIEESEQRERDTGLTSDGAGKQKKPGGMFFYSHSAQTKSTSRPSTECQRNLSEKENRLESSERSKFNYTPDENPYQSKETNGFDKHSSFEQRREENNFLKFNKNIPSKFQDKNASNQSKNKQETYFKCNKSMPSKLQHRTISTQNRTSLAEKDAKKITREVTVERSIKWKNDLCELQKPENKPDYFYEYTKTTKKSVSYVPSRNEDYNDDESTKRPYKGFRKGSDFRNNFHRPDFEHYKQRPENKKNKEFESNWKSYRNGAKPCAQEKPQKSATEFQGKFNCSHCGIGNDPIILRHEIKVIHVNSQGKSNRIFCNSYQTFRPPKKDRNGKVINTDTKKRDGMIPESNISENGGVKIGENMMPNSFQKTEQNYVKPPLKLMGSSSKIKNVQNTTFGARKSESGAALINYGGEISDMIAGSYVAISTFLDNYEQWKDFRRVTMLLFEEVEKSLSQSCHKNKRIVEVAELVGTGCKMIQYIPNVGVSVTAKVIAFLSDVVARMFTSSNSAKSIGMDDFQLKLCLQKDMDATTDIYLYGMQCDIQFQDTCKLIEEFHREIQNGSFEEFEETFETGFLKEISLLNPKHPAVFYKKLGRFYKVLNDHHQSEEGEAFCGAFEDWPDALTTISRLHRRFKTENWDSSSVMKAWEEVYNLLQNNQSTVEDVQKKVQDCICVLMREQSVMEKYVMDLQRQS